MLGLSACVVGRTKTQQLKWRREQKQKAAAAAEPEPEPEPDAAEPEPEPEASEPGALSEEQAATKIQAIHRGNASRKTGPAPDPEDRSLPDKIENAGADAKVDDDT